VDPAGRWACRRPDRRLPVRDRRAALCRHTLADRPAGSRNRRANRRRSSGQPDPGVGGGGGGGGGSGVGEEKKSTSCRALAARATTECRPSAPITSAAASRSPSGPTTPPTRPSVCQMSRTEKPSRTSAPLARATSSRAVSSTSRETDRPWRVPPSEVRYAIRCRARPAGAWSCMPRSQRCGWLDSMRSSAPSRLRMSTPPGLTYSAHGLARGKRAASSSSTRRPCAAKRLADALPAGPPPTTMTSYADRMPANGIAQLCPGRLSTGRPKMDG
jgi:hypothetical protein